MISGMFLTDEIRNELFLTARQMADQKEDKAKIKTVDLEGHVTTKWLRKGISSTFGIEFYAEIDSFLGSTKVTYIVETKSFMNIEEGTWAEIPLPLAYAPTHLN